VPRPDAAPLATAVAAAAQPTVLAGDRQLPVLEPLRDLLPTPGLRRGSVVTVQGSTSLALALVAGPSAAGSWCAAVGLPTLGLAAAAELGVVLARFPLVAAPAEADEWAWAVAATLDAFDLVVAAGPARLGPAPARRLAARVRRRSAVLVVAGAGEGTWPGAELHLAVVARRWEGVGEGHGRLRARRVEVIATGRGAASRPRRVALWLPGPDGSLARVAAPVRVVAPEAEPPGLGQPRPPGPEQEQARVAGG